MEETVFNTNFEYEAPQFFDFHNIQDEEEGQVDSWFDGKPDDEGGIIFDVEIPEEPEKVVQVDSELSKPEDSKPQTMETVDIVKEELPTNNEACKSEETKPKEEDEIESENRRNIEDVDKGCEPEVESNEPEVKNNNPEVESNESVAAETKPKVTERSKIVTSWNGWDRNKPKDCRADADNGGHTQTAGGKIPEKDEPKMITRAQKRNHALNISASSGVPSKKQKETPDGGNKGVNSKRTRSLCSNPEKKLFHLTKPVTPECLKRQKNSRPAMIKLKTTEEMEMECIAKMRKQTRQHIKANESSMKKAITSTSYHPVRVNTGMTQPQEFHFETEKRVKPHPMTTQSDDASKEFLKSLRQHPQSPTWKQRGATVPKPFNLSSSNGSTSKRKRSVMESDGTSTTDSYQSMAYQVYKFQTTTPPRFRTKKATNEASCKSEPAAPKITCPKTPNLATSSRARPVSADVISKEEQEEKEAQAMKNYNFKAKPFDRRVVEYEGLFGVKRCKVKQLTETEPFSFESDERSEARKNDEAVQEQEEDNVVHFKALPQPNFEKVFRPQLKHKRTALKPFSFEVKDKARWQKKESKIQDVYKEEEKLREFKALPLPTDSPDSLPAISSKSCTSFKPFALNTENRGAVKAEKWIQKVKTELEETRKKTVFKAQPSKVAHEAAFEPQRSTKALTEVSEFALNTNRRAVRWEEIASEKTEVKQIVDEMSKEREVQREEEEKEAIAELRRKLVHKAQPIHKYKKVTTKPSDKPLTQPTSPAWSEMKRRRVENYMR